MTARAACALAFWAVRWLSDRQIVRGEKTAATASRCFCFGYYPKISEIPSHVFVCRPLDSTMSGMEEKTLQKVRIIRIWMKSLISQSLRHRKAALLYVSHTRAAYCTITGQCRAEHESGSPWLANGVAQINLFRKLRHIGINVIHKRNTGAKLNTTLAQNVHKAEHSVWSWLQEKSLASKQLFVRISKCFWELLHGGNSVMARLKRVPPECVGVSIIKESYRQW